ncbi:complement C3-like [Pseudophryne corroboree]|uniref:complement C3-like n=1 Tax=Pseudophryne corroboree TaxID=495146 RepID=UPI0030813572
MGASALCVLLLCGIIGAYAQQCLLITSNVLRADSEETIVVDGQGAAFEADITIQDFPRKRMNIAQGRVSVNSANKFVGTTALTIPSKNLEADPTKKQFVYVSVRSPGCTLEKVVLVSFQSGYIFIQTDKTIYTPGSTVLYRIFTMSPSLKPVDKAVVIEFLTPQDVIVKKDLIKQTSKTGIISLSHTLSELVSLGVWTISAKFEDTLIQNYTTNFEVKEYVLPSFEIKLEADQKFFYIKAEELRVKISANYLYGKPVYGKAFTLFGVKKDNERKSLSESLRRVEIYNGEGEAILERKDLVKYFQNEEDMLQWRLYLTVTVITGSGSDLVEAELDDIYIVKSPYKVLYTKTSKYFKPGMPFDLMAFVTNPDGSPAHRVPVEAEPGKVRGITQEDGTVRLTVNTPTDRNTLQITVKTTDPKLQDVLQASSTMEANAYKPIGGNYLHLGVTGGVLKPGENLNINFNIQNKEAGVQNQITRFNYVILNKGRIMRVGTQDRSPGQNLVTLLLPITGDFIPSFRIVAYYVVTTGGVREVVADSVWIDVTDSCMGTLELTGEKKQDNAIQSPGTSMKLRLRADHKASVGLVAVDKGVYVLNSKFKISQSKVWDAVDKYDIGCTQGSGADAPGVFYDAGLALHTNFQMTTAQRSEPLCQPKLKRRRRSSAALVQHKDTKASQYSGKEKMCCQDGMLENPMGDSCERRSRHIQDGEKCIAAFIDCCKEIEKLKSSERELKDHDDLARSDDDSDYIEDSEIQSRTEFPESWLWKVETMNERPDAEGISTKSLSVFLKDSITTWEVLAVSLSESKGICVSKPHDIQVLLNFFIDLKLPYSVVRNEQVEIRAILYNYGNSPQSVRVEWTYNENFCSLSTGKKKYRQDVHIEPESSVAVPFIIVPLTLGFHDVEVKAAGRLVADGVKKRLKVVPEGRRVTEILKSVVLDPETKGKGGLQEELIPSVDAKNIVPKTESETIVTIQGTPVSEMVEKSIDGANINHLITAPFGCGEQNMMSLTPTVIATHFLDSTGQWERVGVQRREQAIQYIRNGIVSQKAFCKPDSSYAAWINSPSSTWLTAYVAKVFALAAKLTDVNRNEICDSVKWLILNKQKPDGLFQEDFPVYHQEMVGGLTQGAKELDTTLTAFVLIAMLESEDLCGHIANLRGSIDSAVSYISEQYPSLNKPYSIAIASYALARAGKLPDAEKLMSASTDNNHWVEPNSHQLSLEATSYAILALLKLNKFEQCGPAVRWITEQQFRGEAWGSTQATIMMFQALSQYQIDVPPAKDLDMDVSFKLPGRSQGTTHRINLQNAMLARSDQTSINQEFVITAKGKGQGSLRVSSVYYAIETEKEKKCNNFDLSVKIKDEPLAKGPEGTKSTVSITICTRYLKSHDATMSIFDISMMTGFAPDINDLNKLKNRVDRYISNYEINKGDNDKSTLILYVDKVSHKEEDCVKFNLYQYFEVGLIQPASVTVYDYYSPENRCTKFYHVDEDSKLLGRICQGDVCRCAEENCFMQQQLAKVDANERFKKACDVSVDYVVKILLTAIEHKDSYDTYVMKIVQVIKEGTEVELEGKTRNFIAHKKCQGALKLQIGREYLTWGVSKDLWNTGSDFSYMITKDTWIEYFPDNRECQRAENRQLCEELLSFAEELVDRGCAN